MHTHACNALETCIPWNTATINTVSSAKKEQTRKDDGKNVRRQTMCDSLNEGSLRLVGDSNPGLQIQSLLC